MLRYSINPDSEIPIYRQLVDQINAEIRSGAIPTGTQLPTVREMAERMHLSCGTVKRVYDRLQEMGDIEMTRRRGTFVKYVRADQDSRKLQAMTAIDRMIRQLSDLSFSPAEIEIFLNLKMREWGLKWSGIRIAMVTDYAELAPLLEKQLNQIGNVHVMICDLRQLREYPYSIDEQSDVILASTEDAQKFGSILPNSEKLLHVAFEMKPECAFEIAAQAGKKLGVLCRGEAFARLVRSRLPEGMRRDLHVLSFEEDLSRMEDMDCLIAAPEEELKPELRRMEAEGRLIRFDYGIDRGSMLYLEERISRIRVERQLQPGAMGF